MKFAVIVVCLIGVPSALKLRARKSEHDSAAVEKGPSLKETLMRHMQVDLGFDLKTFECQDGAATVKAKFRCMFCEKHTLPNLVTMLESNGNSCQISGPSNAKGAPVLTLVNSETLGKEICKANEDEDGYSYRPHDRWRVGPWYLGCNAMYTSVLKGQWTPSNTLRTALGDNVSNIMPQEFQQMLDSPLPEQFSGIHLYELNSTKLGNHRYVEIWPRKGTCTQENKCMLYVGLHALYEATEPSGMLCANLPKYATFDASCYHNLRTVLLLPQLNPNFMEENWNPDPSFLSQMPQLLKTVLKAPPPEEYSGSKVHDDYLFPLIEEFLRQHRHEIDLDRVHVGGASSGADGAMYAALKRPDIFSIAVTADPCAPGFLTMPEQKRLIETMPPLNKRRLRQIIIGRGDQSDVKSICKPHDDFTLDTIADLAKKVPVHIRVYSGLGHGTWGHLMNQWPDLHELLLTGSKRDI